MISKLAMSDPDNLSRRLSLLRNKEYPVLLLLLGIVAILWITLHQFFSITFWNSHDDYAYLSLSHALNIEYYLTYQKWFLDAGLIGHPGVPFYLVSWACLRSAAFLSGAPDVINFALTHTDNFFLATQTATLIITSLSVLLTWHVLRPLSAAARCTAILSFFAVDYYSLRYGLISLGNETFALPITALLFWSVRRLIKATTFEVKPWLLLGGTAGLGYTIKLLYLDILAAAVAIAVVDGLWHRRPTDSLVSSQNRRLAIVLASFGGVVVCVLLMVLGRKGFTSLLKFHYQIISHQGVYGAGEMGIVSPEIAVDNLVTLGSRSSLPYVAAICISLLLWQLWRRQRTGALDYANVIWAVGASTVHVFAAGSVLKHFQPYYAVAISATLPFVIGAILSLETAGASGSGAKDSPGALFAPLSYIAVALSGLIVLAGVLTAKVTNENLRLLHEKARDISDDEAVITAMPLNPGEARLWTYRVPLREFALPFALAYSGIRPLIAEVANADSPDSASIERRDRNYRYIILDRTYFADAAAARNAKGSLEPTQSYMIRPRSDDVMHELKQVIIVERQHN